MQVRDKGLCRSQHSRQQGFMFALVSVALKSQADDTEPSRWTSPGQHPDFREPRSVIMGTNTPALSLPRAGGGGDIIFIMLDSKPPCPLPQRDTLSLSSKGVD